MIRMMNSTKSLGAKIGFVCLLFTSFSGWSQSEYFENDSKKKEPLVKVQVRKSGPYFGIQQGVYTVGELGGEMQFKRVRLKKPHTHGIYIGTEYNIPNNTLGFNAGAWRKPGRFDFTYGLNLAHRTNFEIHRWGGGPTVGYKIFGFHAQVGYNFLTRGGSFQNVNDLYISLRFMLINSRDSNWTWRKRDKKK